MGIGSHITDASYMTCALSCMLIVNLVLLEINYENWSLQFRDRNIILMFHTISVCLQFIARNPRAAKSIHDVLGKQISKNVPKTASCVCQTRCLEVVLSDIRQV